MIGFPKRPRPFAAKPVLPADIIAAAIRAEWGRGERDKTRLVDAGIWASNGLPVSLEELQAICETAYSKLASRNKSRGQCEHGRRRTRCPECHGGSLCEHGKRRDNCRTCKGHH